MGVNIKFIGYAKLTHINLRKVGDDTNSTVCADLKIMGRANVGEDGELIQMLLGCDSFSCLYFWLPVRYGLDAVTGLEAALEGQPECAYQGITHIESWAEYKGGHELKIGGLRMRTAKIGKFKLRPRPEYTVDLSFTASIDNITDREIEILALGLNDDMTCEVLADPDLLEGAK